jgi:hypothetical protein
MPVAVISDCRARVAHVRREGLRVHVGGDHERGECMATLVERDRLQRFLLLLPAALAGTFPRGRGASRRVRRGERPFCGRPARNRPERTRRPWASRPGVTSSGGVSVPGLPSGRPRTRATSQAGQAFDTQTSRGRHRESRTDRARPQVPTRPGPRQTEPARTSSG